MYLRIEALGNIVPDKNAGCFAWHIQLDIQVPAVTDTWLCA